MSPKTISPEAVKQSIEAVERLSATATQALETLGKVDAAAEAIEQRQAKFAGGAALPIELREKRNGEGKVWLALLLAVVSSIVGPLWISRTNAQFNATLQNQVYEQVERPKLQIAEKEWRAKKVEVIHNVLNGPFAQNAKGRLIAQRLMEQVDKDLGAQLAELLVAMAQAVADEPPSKKNTEAIVQLSEAGKAINTSTGKSVRAAVARRYHVVPASSQHRVEAMKQLRGVAKATGERFTPRLFSLRDGAVYATSVGEFDIDEAVKTQRELSTLGFPDALLIRKEQMGKPVD